MSETSTVFFVHAAADATFAGELAQFLERGSRIEPLVQEGRIGPGDTLLSKVEEGQIADVILAILSPDSAHAPWRREEWVPVFQMQPEQAGVYVGLALARACKFPELLRRKNFFDFTMDSLRGRRELKRWLMGLRPPAHESVFAPGKVACFTGRAEELATLAGWLADAPGVAVVYGPEGAGKTALALEFARRYEDDFECQVWLSASERTIEEISGDFAWQLGIRLEGDLGSIVAELRRVCAERRCLVVIDGACEPELAELIPGGYASVLLTTASVEVSAVFPGERLALEQCDETSGSTTELGHGESTLLDAIAVCPAAGFDPEVAAGIAGLDAPVARDALASLHSRGLAWELDRNSGCWWMSPVRSNAEDLAPLHARLTMRRAGHWTSHPQPEKLVSDLMQAIRWSLAQSGGEAWDLAHGLTQTATAILRHCGRLAEALSLLGNFERAARHRNDRRAIDFCLWEQAWILEAWGRSAEAEALQKERQQFCADQMSLEFD